MINNLYTVRDLLTDDCGPVFQAKNHPVAIRKYSQLMETVTPDCRSYFQLMYLGWYDDEIPHLYACSSAEVVDTSVMPAFSDPSEGRILVLLQQCGGVDYAYTAGTKQYFCSNGICSAR